MNPALRGINLSNHFFTAEELPFFCRQQLRKKDIPLWEQKILRFIIDFLDPAEMMIQESSGTTGKPKRLAIPKKAMIHSALLTAKHFKLRQEQVAMLCLPTDYIAGKMMIVRALVTGMTLSRTEPSALPLIDNNIKVDFCAMVPLQVYNLLEKGYSFSHIKTLIIGGSAISPQLESRLLTISSHAYETFGMAETCSHIALRRINGAHARPWFITLPGIKISTDERNCLIIKASFLPEVVVTHDVAEITGYKKFLWKGRYDNIINSGGIKINPEQLEKMISDILGHEVCLIGLPDVRLGQRLVMVTAQRYSPAEKESVLEKLRNALPVHHGPADVIPMPSLPRTWSLKIDRKELLQQVLGMLKKTE